MEKKKCSVVICNPRQISFRVNKLRAMRWIGYVTFIRAKKMHIRLWSGNLKKKPIGRPKHRYEFGIKGI